MKKSIKKILRDETLTDRANGLTHELQEHGGVRVCACTTAQAQAIDTTHETKVLHVGLDAWLQGATRDEPMNRRGQCTEPQTKWRCAAGLNRLD